MEHRLNYSDRSCTNRKLPGFAGRSRLVLCGRGPFHWLPVLPSHQGNLPPKPHRRLVLPLPLVGYSRHLILAPVRPRGDPYRQHPILHQPQGRRVLRSRHGGEYGARDAGLPRHQLEVALAERRVIFPSESIRQRTRCLTPFIDNLDEWPALLLVRYRRVSAARIVAERPGSATVGLNILTLAMIYAPSVPAFVSFGVSVSSMS
jgi:hypothetical protein